MIRFNNEQYRAVTHKGGPMLVLAGPGSGKTAVIVGRVLHLIRAEGVEPNSILVLTFSRAAAAQMEDRFRKETDETYPVSFGTFHAIFYHILKSQGLYRTGEILTNTKRSEILKRVSKRTKADIHNDKNKLNRMIECISLRKMGIQRLLDELNDDESSCLERIYEPYVRQCREEGLLDFDDMINDCLKMLKSNDKILDKWRSRYRYILVDEFQDIDERQYEVLKLLAGNGGNLFCVGDDDQSIYAFRGSMPDVMMRLKDDFQELSILKLLYNYRCPQEVTDAAHKLIARNKKRFDKKQTCTNAASRGCIEYRCFGTADEEAKFCLKTVSELSEFSSGDDSYKGTTAILYRISGSGDIVEEMLRHSLIPYRRKDRSENFYDKEWVRDIAAYLTLAVNDSYDAMLRILNRPERMLSRECMAGGRMDRGAMLDYYKDDDEDIHILERLFKDIDFIRGLNCYGALNYILKRIGMYDHIKNRCFKGNSQEFDEALDELAERARAHSTIKEWVNVIDESLAGDGKSDDACCADGKDEPAIELMTIHGSKGLEFDNVIMIGLQEGVFPGKHCKTREALEEERRLFYVAMTRCRKHLYLIGRSKDDYGKRESRFLTEAGFCD